MRPSQPPLRIDERQLGRHAFPYEEHTVDFLPLDFAERSGARQTGSACLGESRHCSG